MEPTGIVRRIDELGRIVIPKEIRRTLKIKDGSPLEICVEDDHVALKKFSSMTGLANMAEPYADAIHEVTKNIVVVTDRDSIIAIAGKPKKEFLGAQISKYLEECLKSRIVITEQYKKELKLTEDKRIDCSYVISTIVSRGDAVGLLIIANHKEISDNEAQVVSVAAQFLGKHIE